MHWSYRQLPQFYPIDLRHSEARKGAGIAAAKSYVPEILRSVTILLARSVATPLFPAALALAMR